MEDKVIVSSVNWHSIKKNTLNISSKSSNAKNSKSSIPPLHLGEEILCSEIKVEKQNFLDFEAAIVGRNTERWLPVEVIRRTCFSRDAERKNKLKGDQIWNNQEMLLRGRLDLGQVESKLIEMRERRRPRQDPMSKSKGGTEQSSPKHHSGSSVRTRGVGSGDESETERWRGLLFRIPLELDSEIGGEFEGSNIYLKLRIRLENFDVGARNLYSALRLPKLLNTIKPVEKFPEKGPQERLVEFFENIMPEFANELNRFCEKENYQLDTNNLFSTKGANTNKLEMTVSSSMLMTSKEASSDGRNGMLQIGGRRDTEAQRHVRKSLFCHQIVQRDQVLDQLIRSLK